MAFNFDTAISSPHNTNFRGTSAADFERADSAVDNRKFGEGCFSYPVWGEPNPAPIRNKVNEIEDPLAITHVEINLAKENIDTVTLRYLLAKCPNIEHLKMWSFTFNENMNIRYMLPINLSHLKRLKSFTYKDIKWATRAECTAGIQQLYERGLLDGDQSLYQLRVTLHQSSVPNFSGLPSPAYCVLLARSFSPESHWYRTPLSVVQRVMQYYVAKPALIPSIFPCQHLKIAVNENFDQLDSVARRMCRSLTLTGKLDERALFRIGAAFPHLEELIMKEHVAVNRDLPARGWETLQNLKRLDCEGYTTLRTLPSNIYLCSTLKEIQLSSTVLSLPYTLKRLNLSTLTHAGKLRRSVSLYLDTLRRQGNLHCEGIFMRIYPSIVFPTILRGLWALTKGQYQLPSKHLLPHILDFCTSADAPYQQCETYVHIAESAFEVPDKLRLKVLKVGLSKGVRLNSNNNFPSYAKTRVCKYWQRGFCSKGKQCRFAHFDDRTHNKQSRADLFQLDDDFFDQFPNLEVVSVGDKVSNPFPPSLWRIRRLKELTVWKCPVPCFPHEVESLKQLKVLRLKDRTKFLPAALRELNLEVISIPSDPKSSGFSSFGGFNSSSNRRSSDPDEPVRLKLSRWQRDGRLVHRPGSGRLFVSEGNRAALWTFLCFCRFGPVDLPLRVVKCIAFFTESKPHDRQQLDKYIRRGTQVGFNQRTRVRMADLEEENARLCRELQELKQLVQSMIK